LLVYRLVKAFIDDHELYTPSLWHLYLDEISSEEFVSSYNRVLVSTIHKSKGKEFDTVILVAHKINMSDDFVRLFYVGMTRAKKKLIIVTDNKYFQMMSTKNVKNTLNNKNYTEPNKKIFVMGLSDLYMSFQSQCGDKKDDFLAGSRIDIKKLQKDKPYYLIQNGNLIAQLSKKMQEVIATHEKRGYLLSDVIIENVIEWYDEKNDKYRYLPLCKISMEKNIRKIIK